MHMIIFLFMGTNQLAPDTLILGDLIGTRKRPEAQNFATFCPSLALNPILYFSFRAHATATLYLIFYFYRFRFALFDDAFVRSVIY